MMGISVDEGGEVVIACLRCCVNGATNVQVRCVQRAWIFRLQRCLLGIGCLIEASCCGENIQCVLFICGSDCLLTVCNLAGSRAKNNLKVVPSKTRDRQ